MSLYFGLCQSQRTYYVATTGNDSNNGSLASSFLTVKKACDVATSGATIYIKAGTYVENNKITVATGVNLIGEGNTTIVQLNYQVDDIRYGAMELKSTSGTKGNQSISYIKFDGNSNTGWKAIAILGRSNVSVHHCTFENFKLSAITMYGYDQSYVPVGSITVADNPPSVYATGCKVYDNTFTNCSGWYLYGRGAIEFAGQDGMLIYNNSFDFTSRTAAEQGYFGKAYAYFKNCKIHHNTGERTHGATFNFSWELWDSVGGNDFYNNTEDGGGIDIGGHFSLKGDSNYSYNVYNNTIVQSTANKGKGIALTVEGGAKDVWIHNNYIQDFAECLGSTVNQANLVLEDIYVYYNIFKNPGAGKWCVIWGGSAATSTIQNYYLYNNIFINQDNSLVPYYTFFWYPTNGTYHNFYIKNNIITGFLDKGISRCTNGGGTIDWNNIYLENNIIWNNGNSNNMWYATSLVPANQTNLNNLKQDPTFVNIASDYHLQAGSPAINAGQDVGLTNDYDYNTVSNPPEIGIYEYN